MNDDRSADEAEDRERRREGGTDSPQPASAAARRERRSDLTRPAGPAGRRRAAVGRERPARPDKERSHSPAARLVRFLHEVIAELRKVIWPTRKQLVTYTAVVLVFVVFIVTFVALVDLGFQRVVFYVFG